MRSSRLVGLVICGLLALSSVAAAQRPAARSRSSSSQKSAWELGLDGQLSFDLSVPAGARKVTRLQLPVSNFRAGIFTSDVLEIEPFFSLNYVKVEGLPSGTVYDIGVGGLYHFSPDRMKSQVYVRPFLALMGTSGGGGASNSDIGIGVGLGMKWPIMSGRMAWRGEGNVATTGDVTSLNLLWGLSYYTR